MKSKHLFALIGLTLSVILNGQSYSTMETRFNRAELTAEDSSAFIRSGLQKVEGLFDQADLYLSNSGRTSNQMYIANRVPDQFYVEEGDSLDVQALMNQLSEAMIATGQSIRLKFTPTDGYLGEVRTLNSVPAFVFYLVLRKMQKQFGDEKKEVWEVLMTRPRVVTP